MSYKSTLILSVLITNIAFSQSISDSKKGGAFMNSQSNACYTDSFEIKKLNKLNQTIDSLIIVGRIDTVMKRQTIFFSSPLKINETLNWNGAYSLINNVDQNSGTGILDYNCQDRTYDGHKGLDISLWPFSWYLMEQNAVEVVAADDGVIIGKDDGFDSYSCAWNLNQNWNAVYLRHADGSKSWYGHLKEGTLTTKNVGETVLRGEFLGLVGSSGRSTGPHLHFEVYNASNSLVDPFSGTCNTLNAESWWQNQDNYYMSKLNTLATHDAAPEIGCSNEENPHFRDTFEVNNYIFFGAYFTDQLPGQNVRYRIIAPNNSIFEEWTQTFNDNYSISYWYYSYYFSENHLNGVWKYEVDYNNETFSHTFYFGQLNLDVEKKLLSEHVQVFPNPVKNLVIVSHEKMNITEINIYDMTGKSVYDSKIISPNASETKIETSNWSEGVYWIELKLRNEILRQKIVKQ